MSRRYCFIWNNYDGESIMALHLFWKNSCKYMVYGKEVGAEGTPHLQGFFTLKKLYRIAGLRKEGLSCHLEPTKGTSLQAADYCKKDGDYVEFGTPPTPGKRTDLEEACQALKDGATMADLALSHPTQVVKFGRGLTQLKLLIDKPYQHDSVRGLWYVGAPGTGKSHKARADNPGAYVKAQSKWWDGYAGEEVVVLDDLDTNVLGHYLKIWADKYACTGETKGGTVNLRHQKFIVTSNYTIESLWPEDLEMQHAIKRRFKVIKFTDYFKLFT